MGSSSPFTSVSLADAAHENEDQGNHPYTFERLAELLHKDQQIKDLKAREGHKKVVRRLKKWMIVQKVVASADNSPVRTLPATTRVDAVRRIVKEARDIIDNTTLHTPRTSSPLYKSKSWTSPKVGHARRLSLPPPQLSARRSHTFHNSATEIYWDPRPDAQAAARRASQRVRESTIREGVQQEEDVGITIPAPAKDEYMKMQRATSHMAQKSRHKYERDWLDKWNHKNSSPTKSPKTSNKQQPPIDSVASPRTPILTPRDLDMTPWDV